jgi:hypothetical protein
LKKAKIMLVPDPFLLNCLKHHLGYIRFLLNTYIIAGESSFSLLKKDLLSIGESQMDLYTGTLPPHEIALQAKKILVAQNSFLKEDFELWLNAPPRGYKIIMLNDHSLWTLRKGTSESYIHLHPCRYSKNTIRIKATTLKTIISLRWMMEVYKVPISIDLINQARKDFFDAASLKSISLSRGIVKNLTLLFP